MKLSVGSQLVPARELLVAVECKARMRLVLGWTLTTVQLVPAQVRLVAEECRARGKLGLGRIPTAGQLERRIGLEFQPRLVAPVVD